MSKGFSMWGNSEGHNRETSPAGIASKSSDYPANSPAGYKTGSSIKAAKLVPGITGGQAPSNISTNGGSLGQVGEV